MEKLLFRAKTIKHVQWIFGDLFHAGTEPSDGEFAISYWDDEDGWMNDNVQPKTIGQFTGLLDKNGKRIFEGDVVQWSKDNRKYVVTFRSGMFYASVEELNERIYGGFPLWVLCEEEQPCTIVGNIFDDYKILKFSDS